MRLLLLTIGTRGDVQPFVALGAGLARAGHDVVLCTHDRFRALSVAHGLRHASLSDDLPALLDTRAGRALVAAGNPLSAGVGVLRLAPRLSRILRACWEDAWRAAQGIDGVVYAPRALAGYHIAERLDVPAAIAAYVPLLVPTGAFPSWLVPDLPLGPAYNRASYALLSWLGIPAVWGLNRWRRSALGLPPHPWRAAVSTLRRDGRRIPVLHHFSRHVLPPPGDWPEWATVTGYWFLDESAPGGEAPPGLQRFLEAGEPPVYVGFGSMAGPDPARTSRIVLEALARSGRRAIVARGWSGLAPDSVAADPNVYWVDEVRHDWLFPKVAAVVHHAGVGTTAEGLRAGTPTVACPFFADQHLWAKRIHALGAGPRPLPQRGLTPAGLAEAIDRAVREPSFRRRAAEVGARLREEDGVGRAVERVHRLLDSWYSAGGRPPGRDPDVTEVPFA